MEIANLVGVSFRVASIFLGIALAYLVIVMYRRTSGGSKGWLYLMITYVSLGVWAFLQMVFLLVFPNFLARVLVGMILLFTMGISNPLATIKLSSDMRLKRPWCFTRNYFFGFAAVVYLIIGVYNFIITPASEMLAEVLSVTLLSLAVLFLVSFYGYYLIYRGTQVRFWLIVGIGALLVSLGVGLVLLFADCCGPGGQIVGTAACSEWMYDYADVSPAPCMEVLNPLTSRGTIFILAGEILFFYAILKLLKLTSGAVGQETKKRPVKSNQSRQ